MPAWITSLDRALTPCPIAPDASRITTSRPARASARAAASPTTPAPMTMQSTLLRAEGANARGVAELAITLMMSAMRHVPAIDAGMKSGNWLRVLGREIEGRTIAVIGYGRIGCEFAKMACGLGAQVRAYDPFITQPARPIGDFTWHRDLDLLDDADIVSLHAPGRSDGQPLLGAIELACLAPGAIVVNTARASLVSAEAMIAALDSGQVSTYATDVFEQEPPLPSPLLSHPNVIRTSHIGGYTERHPRHDNRRRQPATRPRPV